MSESCDIICYQKASKIIRKYNIPLLKDCGALGCDFSCAEAGKMPNYARFECTDGVYNMLGAMDANAPVVECIAEQDSPCGNVDASGDVTIACDAFNSIYETTASSHASKRGNFICHMTSFYRFIF